MRACYFINAWCLFLWSTPGLLLACNFLCYFFCLGIVSSVTMNLKPRCVPSHYYKFWRETLPHLPCTLESRSETQASLPGKWLQFWGVHFHWRFIPWRSLIWDSHFQHPVLSSTKALVLDCNKIKRVGLLRLANSSLQVSSATPVRSAVASTPTYCQSGGLSKRWSPWRFTFFSWKLSYACRRVGFVFCCCFFFKLTFLGVFL